MTNGASAFAGTINQRHCHLKWNTLDTNGVLASCGPPFDLDEPNCRHALDHGGSAESKYFPGQELNTRGLRQQVKCQLHVPRYAKFSDDASPDED